MTHRVACVAVLLALFVLGDVRAQERRSGFSLGPQLTSLGLGLSVDFRPIDRVSISAGYNLLPRFEVEMDIDDIAYTAEPHVGGGTALANVHPFGSRFVLGAGVFFGGYDFDVVATPAEPVEFGDETYQPEDVGQVNGDFTFGKTAPVLYIGWRGAGLNFGLGLTTTTDADVQLSASGPVSLSPEFQQSLAEEEDRIRDELEVVPVLPYFRIGWQFGL